MTPEMYLSRSGAVKRSSLYFLLFSSVFSRLIGANLFPIVPVLSSAARIPYPGLTIALYLLEVNAYGGGDKFFLEFVPVTARHVKFFFGDVGNINAVVVPGFA